MKVRMVAYTSLFLALALSPLATISAQQDKSTTKPSTTAKASPGGVKLTGCIKEGSAADQYILKTENGKTYQLSAQDPGLDLSWRVGSTVTITGAPAASDPTHVNVKSIDVNATYCP